MPDPSAEFAYLFRHALLRSAAYELQLPGDRARLHALAFELIERAFGGPAPTPATMSQEASTPHALDAVASELAQHADAAISGGLDVREQALHAHRRAADYAERQVRYAEALRHWTGLATLCDPAERGWALVRIGRLLFFTNDLAESERILTGAAAMAAADGNVALEARALSTLGSILRQTARGRETGELYERALNLQRTLDNPRLLAGDLGNLGIYLESSGQLEKAEALYLEALEISRTAHDVAQQARILGYLGDYYRDRGRMDEAYGYLTAAMQLEGNTDQVELALQAERMGVWHAISGNMAEAESAMAEAIALNREMGNLRSLGMALGNMGNVYYDTGRLHEAEQTMLQALAIHREVGNVSFQSNTLANLGAVAIARGDLPGALAYHEEAMQVIEFSRSMAVQGGTMLGYATCLALLGRRDEAEDMWQRGLAILQQGECARELKVRRATMHEVCAKAGMAPLEKETP